MQSKSSSRRGFLRSSASVVLTAIGCDTAPTISTPEVLADADTQRAPRTTEATASTLQRKPPPLDLVEIPAGSFLMGSRTGGPLGDFPIHQVDFSHRLLLSRTPVTQQLFESLLGPEANSSRCKGPDRPVECVSWFDAVRFCNVLSLHLKLEPCYRIEEESVEWVADTGIRLPIEAEWEYACRAGTSTTYFCGDRESCLPRHAWFGESLEGPSHPVGAKEPNPWKLHDMVGNVGQWCWDWHGPLIEASTIRTNPRGPDAGFFRVVRGGNYASQPRALRSACRDRLFPSFASQLVGLRIARTVLDGRVV